MNEFLGQNGEKVKSWFRTNLFNFDQVRIKLNFGDPYLIVSVSETLHSPVFLSSHHSMIVSSKTFACALVEMTSENEENHRIRLLGA